jgi:hypothetical protein
LPHHLEIAFMELLDLLGPAVALFFLVAGLVSVWLNWFSR